MEKNFRELVKEEYLMLIFSIFSQKHTLWVLIRSALLRCSLWVPITCFNEENKKNYPRIITIILLHNFIRKLTFPLLIASSSLHCHSKDCSQISCQWRSRLWADNSRESLLSSWSNASSLSCIASQCLSTADTILEWDSMSFCCTWKQTIWECQFGPSCSKRR